MAGVSTIISAGAAGAGLLSNVIGQNESADAITDGAQAAIDLQRQIYNDQIRRMQPFMDGAYAAHNEYQALLGLSNASAPQPYGMQPYGTQSYGGTSNNYRPSYPQPSGVAGIPSGYSPATYQAWNPRQHLEPEPSGSGVPRTGNQNQTPLSVHGGGQAYEPRTAPTAQQAAIQRFKQSPYYTLPFDEGMAAIQSGAAARGSLLSGHTQKDLYNYGAAQANNNFLNYTNALAANSNMGQSTAQSLGQAGQNFANQSGNQHNTIGSARAGRDQGLWGGLSTGLGMFSGIGG